MYKQLDPLFFDIEVRGKSLDQISARFGEPCHMQKTDALMLYIWRQGENGQYFMALLFQNDICLDRFDEGIDPQRI